MMIKKINKNKKTSIFYLYTRCFFALLFTTITHLSLANSLKGSAPLGVKVFYVDALKGNDDNSGLKPAAAWKTLDKVNKTLFAAGSHILLRCGQKWTGQLWPKGSGSKSLINVISSYGNGAKPIIAGDGVKGGALHFFNQEFWEIRHLRVTNYLSAEENGISLNAWEEKNIAAYVKPLLPPQLNSHNSPKYGVYVEGKDTGELHHIFLVGLDVHGVNGYINQPDEESKNNGGIFFAVTGTAKPTYFNGVLIDSCRINDVDRTGIIVCNSSWNQRSLTVNTNWTPSLHIVITHCLFENTGANALVVRVAQKPLIAHNIFTHCAIKGSGNAAFSFNCDSTIWEYNECRYTKANVDDRDAGGIDADYKTKYTLIQYNYDHNNDYGMLITGGPGQFNDHTVVRYNIFENDGKLAHPTHGKGIIRVSGSATNTMIYNNVVYLGKDQFDTKIVSHEVWKTSPAGTTYHNNIFYNTGKTQFFDLGSSTNNIFAGNLYYGIAGGMPTDSLAIKANPGFNFPGMGKPVGFKIRKGSPAIKAGVPIENNGGYDFFHQKVSASAKPNIGVDNSFGF